MRLTVLVVVLFCVAAIALVATVPLRRHADADWLAMRRATVRLTGTTSQRLVMDAGMARGRPADFSLQVQLACPVLQLNDGLLLSWDQHVHPPQDTTKDHRVRTLRERLPMQWNNGWKGTLTVRSDVRFGKDSMRGTLWAEAPITSGGPPMTCRSGPVRFWLHAS